MLCISLFRCHKRWKFRMQELPWTRHGRSSRQFRQGIWRKSTARRRLFWKHKEIKKQVHFATLMDICHIKNAELEPKLQKYKGRVVLIVKDDSGAYAVFPEQGSSASQMTAAKVMDVIARLPGCAGQAADAVSAYTQVKLEDAPKLLKIPKSDCPDVWIRLPRHKWPKSWSRMEDPVVPLERNLYGHPLAGQSWERHFEKILLRHGWEKVSKWECLFVSKFPKSECPDVWLRLPRHKWPKSCENWRSRGTSWTKLVRSSFCRIAVGKTIRRSFIRTSIGENSEFGMYVRSSETRVLLIGIRVNDIKMAGKKQNMAPMWKKLMKNVDIDEPTSFLDRVYFGCTQRECKPHKSLNNIRRCLSHVFLLEQQKITGEAEISRTNCSVVLRHGGTCSKMRWGILWLANKKVEQLYKVSLSCLDDHQFKKEELESDAADAVSAYTQEKLEDAPR